jgi:hypothetical protein
VLDRKVKPPSGLYDVAEIKKWLTHAHENGAGYAPTLRSHEVSCLNELIKDLP